MDLLLESREQCLWMLSALSRLLALCRFREPLTMWPEWVTWRGALCLPASSRPSASCCKKCRVVTVADSTMQINGLVLVAGGTQKLPPGGPFRVFSIEAKRGI